jgi:hypothetical protein
MARRSSALVWAVSAAVLLVGLYLVVQATLGKGRDPVASSVTFSLAVPPPPLRPGEMPKAPVFKAVEGQTIRLVINSTVYGAVHVHGYEKHVPLSPGSPAKLEFPASLPGRFELHLHAPDQQMDHVATLEVAPR